MAPHEESGGQHRARKSSRANQRIMFAAQEASGGGENGFEGFPLALTLLVLKYLLNLPQRSIAGEDAPEFLTRVPMRIPRDVTLVLFTQLIADGLELSDVLCVFHLGASIKPWRYHTSRTSHDRW